LGPLIGARGVAFGAGARPERRRQACTPRRRPNSSTYRSSNHCMPAT